MGCEYECEWVERLYGKEMHLLGQGFEEPCRWGPHGEDLEESKSDKWRKYKKREHENVMAM